MLLGKTSCVWSPTEPRYVRTYVGTCVLPQHGYIIQQHSHIPLSCNVLQRLSYRFTGHKHVLHNRICLPCMYVCLYVGSIVCLYVCTYVDTYVHECLLSSLVLLRM